jgi:hypothetical protein
MVAQRTAQMAAILAGIGGFLSYLALHVAARGIASLRRPKSIPIRGQPPPTSQIEQDPTEPASATEPADPSHHTHFIAHPTQTSNPWKEQADRLAGSYNTYDSTYAGYVTNWQSQRRKFFIVNPPQSLRDHSQPNQLVHRGNGRYLIKFATRPPYAGAGIRAIEQMLVEAESEQSPLASTKEICSQSERIVVYPVKRERVVVSPVERSNIVVQPEYRPYWEMQDWKASGDRLTGEYRTPLGSSVGYIKHYKSREPLFYIVNPPKQLSRHRHHACFRDRGKGHVWVHFGTKPTNPDSGIREIEKILAEALRLPRR